MVFKFQSKLKRHHHLTIQKTKNYDSIKKKGEVGLPDFWNGRVKSSMDPLPSELTTSQI